MNQQIEVTKETADALQASGIVIRYVVNVSDIAVQREEEPEVTRKPRRVVMGSTQKFRIAKGDFAFQPDSIAETALFYAKALFTLNDRFTRLELTEKLCEQFGTRFSRQQIMSVVHYMIKHHAIIPAEGFVQRKEPAAA